MHIYNAVGLLAAVRTAHARAIAASLHLTRRQKLTFEFHQSLLQAFILEAFNQQLFINKVYIHNRDKHKNHSKIM